MRDRLTEILRKAPLCGFTVDDYYSVSTIEKLADHLLANGVNVPPCEVGDMVYRVSFVHKNVSALRVEGFLRNLASWKVHCTAFIPAWLGNKKEHIYISFSEFGKTVFTDPNEADKALAEREGKG